MRSMGPTTQMSYVPVVASVPLTDFSQVLEASPSKSTYPSFPV